MSRWSVVRATLRGSAVARFIRCVWANTEPITRWFQLAIIAFVAIYGYERFLAEQPSTAPNIVVSGSVDVGAQRDSLVALELTLDFRNPSKGDVEILGAWFHLVGYSIAVHGMSGQQFSSVIGDVDGEIRRIPKYGITGDGEIVHVGRLFCPLTYVLRPQEEAPRRFIAFVPSRFDMVQMRVDVHIAKPGHPLVSKWSIYNNRYMDLNHFVKRASGELALFDAEKNDEDAKLARQYGIARGVFFSEASLWRANAAKPKCGGTK